jgi:hypothetical protein
MPEREFVEDIMEIQHTGVLDFDGLYKSLAGWFKKQRYNFAELDYKEFRERGGHHLHIKWEGKRMVTDYVKYVIEVTLQLNNFTDVKVKGRQRVNGEVKMKIIGFLEKDYEDRWSKKSWIKFIREVYDKFVGGSHLKEMQEELRGEMRLLRGDMKAFLNLQKVGK